MVDRYFPCLPHPTDTFSFFCLLLPCLLPHWALYMWHKGYILNFIPSPFSFFSFLFFILEQSFTQLCRPVLNSLCLHPKQALAQMSLAVLPGPVTISVTRKIVTRNSIFHLSCTQLGRVDSCLQICLGKNEWFCHVWYKSVFSSSPPLADIVPTENTCAQTCLMFRTLLMTIKDWKRPAWASPKKLLNLWHLMTSVALIIEISRASLQGWCGGTCKWTIKRSRQTAGRCGKHIII